MGHIVPMPKGFIAVRILQIVFALVVIALTAFLISNTIGFVFSATGFGIFCGIITLIIVVYGLVAERAVKAAYNMWAILALDILMVIFWLSAMGSLASLRAAFTLPVDIYYKRSLIQKRYVYSWAGNTYLDILAATAGVAAIELVLFIISLVMFSMRLHRHRTASSTGKTSSPNFSTVQVAPEKIELQENTPQPYQAPAPAYPNYQPPVMQSQPTGPATFTPASPAQTGQAPYQPTMSPPPQSYPTPTASPSQFGQPLPQYPGTAPPQGYHEVSGQHGPH